MNYDPSAVLDPDYGILCGVPQVREIYHTQLYRRVQVVATDIGRAPQPAPSGVPLDESEIIPPDEELQALNKRKPYTKHAVMREINQRVIDHIRDQDGHVTTVSIAQALGISQETMRQVLDTFGINYDIRKASRPGRPGQCLAIRLKRLD